MFQGHNVYIIFSLPFSSYFINFSANDTLPAPTYKEASCLEFWSFNFNNIFLDVDCLAANGGMEEMIHHRFTEEMNM